MPVADLATEFFAQCVEWTFANDAVLSKPTDEALESALGTIMGIGCSWPWFNSRLDYERAGSLLIEILKQVPISFGSRPDLNLASVAAHPVTLSCS